MAAIAFNTAQVGNVRGRLETVCTILRETLDAFVSYRIRLTAPRPNTLASRQLQDAPSRR